MTTLAEVMKQMPPGKRDDTGPGSDPIAVRNRKVATSKVIVRASWEGRMIGQREHIYSLPEFADLKSAKGIGDFTGRAHRGLDLDQKKINGDKCFPPTARNGLKAWEWLTSNKADQECTDLAAEYGFAGPASFQAALIARYEAERLEAVVTVTDSSGIAATEKPGDELNDDAELANLLAELDRDSDDDGPMNFEIDFNTLNQSGAANSGGSAD